MSEGFRALLGIRYLIRCLKLDIPKGLGWMEEFNLYVNTYEMKYDV